MDHYQAYKKLVKPVKVSINKVEFKKVKANQKLFHSAEKKEKKVPIFRKKESQNNFKVRDININGLNSTLNVKAYCSKQVESDLKLNKDLIQIVPDRNGKRLQVLAPPGFQKTQTRISPLIREKLKDLLDLEHKNANMLGPEIMKLMDKN